MVFTLLISCSSESTIPQNNHNNQIVEKNGMVFVPTGEVDLGPRRISAVDGWTPPTDPTGMTPSQGQGSNQRAAGGPPLPMQHPNGTKIGVGHVRPGSGAPSTPPNMPGNKAKYTGDSEQKWTANPGMQMKVKRVPVQNFWIDRTEVTRNEYKKFLDATGYRPPYVDEEWADDDWNWSGTNFPKGTGDHPVVLVNFYDAQAFCIFKGKRLPTEAEWQLAALGDAKEGRTYPWGNTYDHSLSNHGQILAPNFDDSDGYLRTSPVEAFWKGASPYGALDMFGNAWEFTSDYRRSSWTFYQIDSLNQYSATGPGLYVAVRGGSYFFDMRPNPGGERNEFLPEIRRKTSGFRCAQDA